MSKWKPDCSKCKAKGTCYCPDECEGEWLDHWHAENYPAESGDES